MFYDQEILHRKLSATLSGFVIYFVLLLYINCIPIVSRPDDGHRCEENLMVKNNNM
jgi:hypothetical protein